jgi:hypothetical protein
MAKTARLAIRGGDTYSEPTDSTHIAKVEISALALTRFDPHIGLRFPLRSSPVCTSDSYPGDDHPAGCALAKTGSGDHPVTGESFRRLRRGRSYND